MQIFLQLGSQFLSVLSLGANLDTMSHVFSSVICFLFLTFITLWPGDENNLLCVSERGDVKLCVVGNVGNNALNDRLAADSVDLVLPKLALLTSTYALTLDDAQFELISKGGNFRFRCNGIVNKSPEIEFFKKTE